MKRLIALLLFFLCFYGAGAQVITKITGDSIRIYQTGNSPAELIIENSTRGRKSGFLRNRINGRTEFAFVLDSVWKDGGLLKFRRGEEIISINTLAVTVDDIFGLADSLNKKVAYADSTVKYVTPYQADNRYVQIQTKPPTAGATPVSGSGTMEYTSTAIGGTDTSFTDNGSYGRQAGDATTNQTANISSVVYDGTNQSFTQPTVGSSNSFTKSVTVTKNVNKLVTCTVTTVDEKQASANFTHSWLPRRYRGWVSDTSGIGTPAFANSIIWALTSELSTSKIWSFNTSAPPAGGGWYVIVTWGATGAPTGITFNNNPAIDAMNIVQRSFTNQRAYTDTWYFTWNKNKQTASSDVSIQ